MICNEHITYYFNVNVYLYTNAKITNIINITSNITQVVIFVDVDVDDTLISDSVVVIWG
jgi:hypothetical protein